MLRWRVAVAVLLAAVIGWPLVLPFAELGRPIRTPGPPGGMPTAILSLGPKRRPHWSPASSLVDMPLGIASRHPPLSQRPAGRPVLRPGRGRQPVRAAAVLDVGVAGGPGERRLAWAGQSRLAVGDRAADRHLGPRRGRVAVGGLAGWAGAVLGRAGSRGRRPSRGRAVAGPVAGHVAPGPRGDCGGRGVGCAADGPRNHRHRHDPGPHVRRGSLHAIRPAGSDRRHGSEPGIARAVAVALRRDVLLVALAVGVAVWRWERVCAAARLGPRPATARRIGNSALAD